VRKIISILLALGVILGLSLMAAPVAAAPCVCPTTMTPVAVVTLDGTICASDSDTFIIGPFAAPVVLTAPNDKLSVDFAPGTSLASVLPASVTVNAIPVTSITVSGAHIEFPIPAVLGPIIPVGFLFTVQIAGVVNPATDGTYCLYVDYKLVCCDAVPFGCGTYTVAPYTKEIGCHFDFSPDYVGLGEDFIPAFKACGDSIHGTLIGPPPGYVTSFYFILRDENGGCNNPCTTPSKFWFEVTECPPGETIWFNVGLVIHPALSAADIGTEYSLMGLWAGWPPPDISIPMQIHFSSPGEYEICFYLECPAVGCPTCAGPTVITTCCLPAKVYQYLDSYKIPLEPKWNLISLPLFPYDTSIESVLGAVDRPDQLKSVWYFGQCEAAGEDGVWHSESYAAGTFTGDVDNIVAGKAYWIRTLEPSETGYVAGANGFWVFGTHAIMPDPTGVDMGYFDVCEGWNMVGFKAPWLAGVPIPQIDWAPGPTGYLWNFNPILGGVHYGLIYDWVEGLPMPGDWQTFAPGTAVLQPGQGYWIPFDGDSEIYPSA